MEYETGGIIGSDPIQFHLGHYKGTTACMESTSPSFSLYNMGFDAIEATKKIKNTYSLPVSHIEEQEKNYTYF